MAEDWDLHAVVRGCSTVTSSSSSTTTTSGFGSGSGSCYLHHPAEPSSSSSSAFSIFKGEEGSHVLSLSAYPFEARSSIEELHELCKPFFSKSQPLSPLSSLSSSVSSAPPKSLSTQHQQRNKQPHAVTTPRSKRRYKNLCLLAFDTPEKKKITKKDLGLAHVIKIMFLRF
ncbi:WRKY transcription factor 22-like [Cajanus cajan]|uniref:WRKY transcription factor 22-like n=1 Tax=Cajanus cajan TaxID=3821 RepID=UPI00098DCEB6|nr:WRKY transcription factor 22-like [Cajanus cajan]